MAIWNVELEGNAREVYEVEADTEAEALAKWETGQHVLTEAYGMEAVSAEKTDD